MIALYIASITMVPRLAGRMSFPATANRVAGEDGENRTTACGLHGAEDRDPGKLREERLEGLEPRAQDHVLDVDLDERLPETGEPRLELGAEQVEQQRDQQRHREPGRDQQRHRESGREPEDPCRTASPHNHGS
jgi:hypothetical protein